jgi:diaminopimelate decarboxylase
LKGVLCSTGDVLAQQAIEQKGLSDHDWMRTGRLGAYGFFVIVG